MATLSSISTVAHGTKNNDCVSQCVLSQTGTVAVRFFFTHPFHGQSRQTGHRRFSLRSDVSDEDVARNVVWFVRSQLASKVTYPCCSYPSLWSLGHCWVHGQNGGEMVRRLILSDGLRYVFVMMANRRTRTSSWYYMMGSSIREVRMLAKV